MRSTTTRYDVDFVLAQAPAGSRAKRDDMNAPTRSPGSTQVLPKSLRAPRVHDRLIERRELLERLRAGRELTLTLVCAPAGYGKTTLLAQWEKSDSARTPFVWLSLEERDSDPILLWEHLIAGLHEAHAPAGTASLRMLSGGSQAILETVLPTLVRELEDAPPLVLVLDDWHVLSNPLCDQMMGAFVEHAPDVIQIVVSSRSDPGLQVARLRANGVLAEIRERDLRVSPTEAAALFLREGIALEPREIERLTERTEGWLAGLFLALIVIKGHEDRRRFVADFSGESRLLVDYLTSEILGAVTPELRDFLLRTSVLDRLSAPLCDAVLERHDSAAMLRAAERANLFLVALDEAGTEYRYHQLFRAVLRRELDAVDPDAVPGLHARASAWLEAHGGDEPAIQHAIASRNLARASDLITRVAVPLMSAGRMATVNRWFDALSWPEALADRQLALMRALAAGLSAGGSDQIEYWLAIADAEPDSGPLPNGVTSLHSGVAMVRSSYLSRGIADAERGARLVLEREPSGSEWRYAGLVPLGQALFLAGRHEEARAPLTEARALPGARRRATTPLAMSYLALIELADEDAARSERLARDAVALIEKIGHASSPVAAVPHVALACALMHGADLHEGVDHLERAIELAERAGSVYWLVYALLHLATARHRLGDAQGASEALLRARAEMDELPDLGVLGALCEETDDELHHRYRREGFRGDELSEAELRILRRLAQGHSLPQVARELYLSPNTVKTHRRTIYRKLGVATRSDAVARAAELDLLD